MVDGRRRNHGCGRGANGTQADKAGCGSRGLSKSCARFRPPCSCNDPDSGGGWRRFGGGIAAKLWWRLTCFNRMKQGQMNFQRPPDTPPGPRPDPNPAPPPPDRASPAAGSTSAGTDADPALTTQLAPRRRLSPHPYWQRRISVKQSHTEETVRHTDDQQNTGTHKEPGAPDEKGADRSGGSRAGSENVEPAQKEK